MTQCNGMKTKVAPLTPSAGLISPWSYIFSQKEFWFDEGQQSSEMRTEQAQNISQQP